MNNTFSMPRFGLLFRKTILERPIQLLGLPALSLSVVFLSYLVIKTLFSIEDAQNISFVFGMTGGGCILASLVYGYFSSNAMGSSYLTLPASHFEKWLCGVLITGVLYVVIFLLLFHCIDVFCVGAYHSGLDPDGPFYKELYASVEVMPLTGFVAGNAFVMFANFEGAMLVGSLYFNKAGFIKTALLLCAVCFGMYLLNMIIATAMMKNVTNALPYRLVWIEVGKDWGRIDLPEHLGQAFRTLFTYILPAMFWVLAYVRLKEKEF